MNGRTIAIGDIHGCAQALAVLLETLRPSPDDCLITLGDYCDKGPDTRAVFDQLLDLGTRCRLIPLLGNHDAAMLAAAEGAINLEAWLSMSGATTLASYGTTDDVTAIPESHRLFLQDCRLYYEGPAYFCVHAAYVPELPLSEQPEGTLMNQGLRDGLPAPHHSGKRAIVGHTSQKDGEILDGGHIVCIDTNCSGGGWLTAMDVDTGQVWQVDQNGHLRK